MIPGLGLGALGPLIVLVGIGVLFGLVSEVAFFTVLLDRPQLPTRRRAAVIGTALIAVLAVAALVLPYEGEDGHQCRRAVSEYGFSTDALRNWGAAEDPCAAPGQVLVLFGWTTPLLLAVIVGIWWWAGDS